jgi:hypothetical protein
MTLSLTPYPAGSEFQSKTYGVSVGVGVGVGVEG